MAIALNTYSAGETQYVTKFNNDFLTIQTAVNALQAAVLGATGATGVGFLEVWPQTGLVGASAYVPSLDSNTGLSFTSGAVWNALTQNLARWQAVQSVAFVGLASGLYYLNADAAGILTASTAAGTVAPYSVYYSAPSFASVTRLYPILLQGDDYARMLSSPLFGSMTRVGDRLCAIESLLSGVSGISGGGGPSGVTVSGTQNPRWTVATSVVSAQSAVTGAFQVYRGGDVANSAPEVRWNETLDRWEFTNDSTSYVPLGSLEGLNLGAGRSTRLVMVASAPIVLNEPGRSATSLAEISTLSLSTYVSTTTVAALLRGYVLDSAPGSALAGGSVAGIQFFKDSATTAVNPEACQVVAVASAALRYDGLWVPVSNQACAYIVETASICSVKFALVGYMDTVQGVGTQYLSGTRTGIGVSAGVGSHMKLSSTLFAAAAIRSLVHYVETSGSMGAGSLYDVEFYATSNGARSQLASALLFQATNVDASAAYVTRLPWVHLDSESLTQMYLRLSNNGTTSGTFSVVVRAEQYA